MNTRDRNRQERQHREPRAYDSNKHQENNECFALCETRKGLLRPMKELVGEGRLPKREQQKDQGEHQRKFRRRPEVSIRLASEWIHFAEWDSNGERFWNAVKGKRATFIVEEF